MKYDGLSESQKGESSWEDNALKVQHISDAEKKDTDRASKPLQKSLSHTSPFSSAPSFNLLLPLQLLPLPPSLPLLPSPPALRWMVYFSLSLSLSFRLSRGHKQKQSVRVCVRVCVREAGAERGSAGSLTETLPLPQTQNPTLQSSPQVSVNASQRSTPLPPRPVKRPPWSHVNPRLLSHLGSDFGLPPWGEAPGTGSFEVRRDSEDLGYPRGKHFALGTVGCKPPWAGGQRSSTMDYLVGIFLLLCGVALPGRVAPQHTKDNVPRLKLSYKGKFCNQTHLYFVMHTSFITFFILITLLIPIYTLKLDSFLCL